MLRSFRPLFLVLSHATDRQLARVVEYLKAESGRFCCATTTPSSKGALMMCYGRTECACSRWDRGHRTSTRSPSSGCSPCSRSAWTTVCKEKLPMR